MRIKNNNRIASTALIFIFCDVRLSFSLKIDILVDKSRIVVFSGFQVCSVLIKEKMSTMHLIDCLR